MLIKKRKILSKKEKKLLLEDLINEYGEIISSHIDNFLRPIIVSKRTQMNSSLILIGMIGGLFLFGILGLILGPLILAYLFIILDIYRRKDTSGIFIQQPKKGR